MYKILVPTDFSICASKAIDYAIAICKRTHAELILMHVCELMDEKLEHSRSYVEQYNHEVQADANQKLDLLKRSLQATNDVIINTRLYSGPVSGTIIYAAKKYNVDLVVMGTHGANGLKQLIFGSQTASVISKCEIPVLAIPSDYHFITKGEMLFAVNDEEFTNEQLIPFFILVVAFQMNVTLATFTESNKGPEAFLKDKAKIHAAKENLLSHDFPGEIKILHLTGDSLIHALQDCVRKHQVDILTMITHKREGFQKLFNKSNTRKMAYTSNVPLLAIPYIESNFIDYETENKYEIQNDRFL